MDWVRLDRQTLPRQPRCPQLSLHGAVPGLGVRTDHRADKPAGHRHLPVGIAHQAVPLRFHGPNSFLDHFSTRARANERQDWRTHADFAPQMIARARALNADTELDV